MLTALFLKDAEGTFRAGGAFIRVRTAFAGIMDIEGTFRVEGRDVEGAFRVGGRLVNSGI